MKGRLELTVWVLCLRRISVGYAFMLQPITPKMSKEVTTRPSALLMSKSKEISNKSELEELRSRYGEKARKFRRTHYGHDSWIKHRAPDRIFKNLATTFYSGLFRSLSTQVWVVTGFAVLVAIWNSVFVEGFVDLEGDQYKPLLETIFEMENLERFLLDLPQFISSLSMSALSLLLGES